MARRPSHPTGRSKSGEGAPSAKIRRRLPPGYAATSASGGLVWYPSRVFEAARRSPASLAELMECVQAAYDAGRRLKAFGTGHAASDVAVPADIVVVTTGLNRWLDTRGMDSSRAAGARLIRVEGGWRISDLNQSLHERGLAFSNMPNYTGQTIAGALATGSHGSNLALAPLADYVVSLELVTIDDSRRPPRARRFRIEPRQGVTDPASFPTNDEQELIQDDRTFYSSVVSFGCFGIVYAVTLKVRDRFQLTETHELNDWPNLRQGLTSRVAAEAPFFEIHLQPQVEARKGTRLALITRREERAKPPGGAWNDPDRLLDAVRTLRTWSSPSEMKELGPLFTVLKRSFTALDRSFGDCLGRHPETVACLYRKLFENRARSRFHGFSHEILPLGIGDILAVHTVEIGLPIDSAASAVDLVFAKAAEWQREGDCFTAPVALRFTAPSKHYLSMSYGRPTCMLEVTSFIGSRNAIPILNSIEEALYSLEGRPHWGQMNRMTAARAEALYPKYRDVRAVYSRFNRLGIFTNAFSKSVFDDNPLGGPVS